MVTTVANLAAALRGKRPAGWRLACSCGCRDLRLGKETAPDAENIVRCSACGLIWRVRDLPRAERDDSVGQYG